MKKREKPFSIFSKYSVLALGLFKLVSTIIYLTGSKLQDIIYPFVTFAFPFSFAVFYDTEFVAQYGKAMLISFFALILMWILLFVLLLFKNPVVIKIGCVLFVIANCVDITCVVWSLINATFMIAKVLNLLFSVFLIVFTMVVFVKLQKIVKK